MSYVPAAAADKEFQKRVGELEKRRSRLAKGYLMEVSEDGLVVAKPRPYVLRVPFGAVIATAVAVLFFKGFALAYLGHISYDAKISQLASGTVSERIGAFLMQADPLSRGLGSVFDKILG